MAKISELPVAPNPLDGSELVPLVQDGETYLGSVNEFAASVVGDVASLNITSDLAIDRLVDSDGKFLAGTLRDGRRIVSQFAKRPVLTVKTDMLAKRQIVVSDHNGASWLTSGSNNYAPEWLAGDQIGFMSDRSGSDRPYVMNIDGTGITALAPAVRLEHHQCISQSLGIGANTSNDGSSGAALSTDPVSPGKALMFELTGGAVPYGPRPMIDGGTSIVSNHTIKSSAITGLTDLKEAVNGIYGETIWSAYAAQYLKDAPEDLKILCDSHGRGAAPWREPYNSAGVFIGPQSAYFAAGQVLQQMGCNFAGDEGWAYQAADLPVLHGEADASGEITELGAPPTSSTAYRDYMIEAADLYNVQSRHDSRYHNHRRLLQKQISSFVLAQPGAFDIAVGQVMAALADPRIYCLVAAYMVEHGDTIHIDAPGQQVMGAQLGKWARRLRREGMHHDPFVAKSAELIGGKLYIHMYKQIGQLQIRTDLGVSAIAQSGITFDDDASTAVALTGVAVADPDEYVIEATPSTTMWGANPTLYFGRSPTHGSGYGSGPDDGARTNICDSDTETSVLTDEVLRNWALHYKVAIT